MNQNIFCATEDHSYLSQVNALMNNKNIDPMFHQSINLVLILFEKTAALDANIKINLEIRREWKTISSFDLICIDEGYLEFISTNITSRQNIIEKITRDVLEHIDGGISQSEMMQLFKKIAFEICFYVPLLHEYSHNYDNSGQSSITNESEADSRAMSCAENIFETYKKHLLTLQRLDEQVLEKLLSVVLLLSCVLYTSYLEAQSPISSTTHPSKETRSCASIDEAFDMLRKRGHPPDKITKNLLYIYSLVHDISIEEAQKRLIAAGDQ